MSQKTTATYFPALTGVRALAAYLVFVSHFSYIFEGKLPALVLRVLGEMHIGVSLFFVLSGFLITYRYYYNFNLNGAWFRQYLKNRVARIYPMYFLLTLAAFAYYFITRDPIITKGFNHPVLLLFLNITFLRGFFYQFWDTGIAQGWSLTVEECFYFSAPILFLIAKKYNKFYFQPLVITSLGIALVLLFRPINWYGFFGNFTFMMLFTFFGRCFEFFVGIKLARYVLKNGNIRSNKINFSILGSILILACLVLMALQPIIKPWNAGLETPIGIITNNYLLCIAVALFFYGLLTEETLFKKILANPFTELLGKSSYIFYLIHLGWLANLLHGLFDNLNDVIFKLYDAWGLNWHSPFENEVLNLVLLFIILNAISILLFKTIEEPLNHYIRRSNFLIKHSKANQNT